MDDADGERQEDDGDGIERGTTGRRGPRETDEQPDEGGASGRIQFVRVLGAEPVEPVVRRIGDRELYLGNRSAADPAAHGQRFDHVVSATLSEQPLTTHHCPMHDGPNTDWNTFAAAVDTVRSCVRREGTTLVHCKAGISRSATLIATTIAAEEARTFEASFEIVRRDRADAISHPALLEHAVCYLAAETDFDS